MKDPVLKQFGLKKNRDLNDEEFEVLTQTLVLFAQAGGVLTWDLWRRLTTQTKAAFIAANERVRAEDAAAIGMASQGPKQAARVMAASDGGDLQAQVALDHFVERFGERRVS